MRSSHPPCLFPTWTGSGPQASKPCMQRMRQTCRWKGLPGLCQSSRRCHLYFPYLGKISDGTGWKATNQMSYQPILDKSKFLWPSAAPQKASKVRFMVLPGFQTLGSVVKQMAPRHTSHSTGVSQGPRGVPLADAVAFERFVSSKASGPKTSAASKFCKAPAQNEQSTQISHKHTTFMNESDLFVFCAWFDRFSASIDQTPGAQGRTQRHLGKRIFQWHHVASPKKTSQETSPKACSLEDCDNDMIDLIAPQVHTQSTLEHSLLTIAKKTQKAGGFH